MGWGRKYSGRARTEVETGWDGNTGEVMLGLYTHLGEPELSPPPAPCQAGLLVPHWRGDTIVSLPTPPVYLAKSEFSPGLAEWSIQALNRSASK